MSSVIRLVITTSFCRLVNRHIFATADCSPFSFSRLVTYQHTFATADLVVLVQLSFCLCSAVMSVIRSKRAARVSTSAGGTSILASISTPSVETPRPTTRGESSNSLLSTPLVEMPRATARGESSNSYVHLFCQHAHFLLLPY